MVSTQINFESANKAIIEPNKKLQRLHNFDANNKQ